MTTIRRGSPVLNSCGVVIGHALPPLGVEVPFIRTVADAEALFGRGAEVIGARGGVAECLAAEAPPVVSVPASRGVVDNRPPPVALNESYVSRVTGEEHRVVSVLVGHAHLRDRRGCVRHWSFELIARDLMLCDPSRPKGTAPAVLAAENAALREALAASGELLAEAHAEVERLRGAK